MSEVEKHCRKVNRLTTSILQARLKGMIENGIDQQDRAEHIRKELRARRTWVPTKQ